jgi:hypothetical protein
LAGARSGAGSQEKQQESKGKNQFHNLSFFAVIRFSYILALQHQTIL